MRPSNPVIFNALDASSSRTSIPFSLNEVMGWSAQFVFTGSPVGTLKAQVSSDPGTDTPFNGDHAANWSDLQDSSLSISGAGIPGYNYNGSFYNWVRFIYTASSGSGTISGRLNIKGA